MNKGGLSPSHYRLQFVDIARSFAIFAMLTGHFFGVSLEREFHSTEYIGFSVWVWFRTYTAAIFITLSGVTIAYLLSQCGQQPVAISRRVKRASIRAFALIAWGAVLHLNLRHIDRYLQGTIESWVFAFHVLQCIGVGMLLAIGIFLVHRRLIRIGHVSLHYFVAGTAVMIAHAYLSELPDGDYFPSMAHEAIQNAFVGPHSIFPLVPWSAFLLYGSGVGALLSRSSGSPSSVRVALTMMGTGLLLWQLAPVVIGWSNHLLQSHLGFPLHLNNSVYLYVRVGVIWFLLGGLMLFLMRFPRSLMRFRTAFGDQTLRIYILHVVILYGGITGFGLNRYLRESMNLWQASLGAVGFALLMAVLAQPTLSGRYVVKMIRVVK